jgi:hypothetical protein
MFATLKPVFDWQSVYLWYIKHMKCEGENKCMRLSDKLAVTWCLILVVKLRPEHF